jgi:hypothetical protein
MWLSTPAQAAAKVIPPTKVGPTLSQLAVNEFYPWKMTDHALHNSLTNNNLRDGRWG